MESWEREWRWKKCWMPNLGGVEAAVAVVAGVWFGFLEVEREEEEEDEFFSFFLGGIFGVFFFEG